MGLAAWQCVLLASVKAVFVREKFSSGWEAELA